MLRNLLENAHITLPLIFINQDNSYLIHILCTNLENKFIALKKLFKPDIMNFHTFFLFTLDLKIVMLIHFYLYSLLKDIRYLIVQVDGLILTGDNAKIINSFMEILAHQFSIKDLRLLSYFIGVIVFPNKDDMLLS